MPTYEFRCQDCRKKFEVFLTYSQYDDHKTACPACQSLRLVRVIRKVRVARGDKGRLSALSDSANLDAIDQDPRSLGRMMRQMKNEVGADDMPAEFDEVVSRLEKGESPEDIERAMPDLGDGMDGE
jgi:putative FmdB family regulatory protein